MTMVNYTPKLAKEIKRRQKKSILVKDVMQQVFESFTEEMDINDASYTLVRKKISGAPVINSANEAVGFLSEKDCLKYEIDMKYYNDQSRTVRDYMSRTIIPVHPNAGIHDAIDLFTKFHFYCYPVVEETKVVGVVYRRAVLEAVCSMAQTDW